MGFKGLSFGINELNSTPDSNLVQVTSEIPYFYFIFPTKGSKTLIVWFDSVEMHKGFIG